MRYPALLDGKKGAYGIVFPDLPGCHAMGATIDNAIANAQEAIADWMDAAEARGRTFAMPSAPEDISVPQGTTLLPVLLVRPRRTEVKRVNLYLDAAIAETIVEEAKRLRISRKDYVEHAIRTAARTGA